MSLQKVVQPLCYFDVARRKFLSLALIFFLNFSLLFSFYVNISDLWLDVTYSFGGIFSSQVCLKPSALFKAPLNSHVIPVSDLINTMNWEYDMSHLNPYKTPLSPYPTTKYARKVRDAVKSFFSLTTLVIL